MERLILFFPFALTVSYPPFLGNTHTAQPPRRDSISVSWYTHSGSRLSRVTIKSFQSIAQLHEKSFKGDTRKKTKADDDSLSATTTCAHQSTQLPRPTIHYFKRRSDLRASVRSPHRNLGELKPLSLLNPTSLPSIFLPSTDRTAHDPVPVIILPYFFRFINSSFRLPCRPSPFASTRERVHKKTERETHAVPESGQTCGYRSSFSSLASAPSIHSPGHTAAATVRSVFLCVCASFCRSSCDSGNVQVPSSQTSPSDTLNNTAAVLAHAATLKGANNCL